MYYFYNAILFFLRICLTLCIPVLFLFNKKLYSSILERLGHYDFSEGSKRPIWIQAASVGEVMIAEKLIKALKNRIRSEIVLTATTSAGKAMASGRLHSLAHVLHFPFDFRSSIRRSLETIKPALFIMIETEIWPNLLIEARRRGIPCMIVNGRISERGYGRYSLIRSLTGNALKAITLACMSSSAHASRIHSLGLDGERIRVTGNIKFDLTQSLSEENLVCLKRILAIDEADTVFIAGSTAEGEDEQLLNAYVQMRTLCQRPIFIIAPRHIRRVGDIEKILKDRALAYAKLSSLKDGASRGTSEIIIVDTIGDLAGIYSFGKIVFIGGSLVPIGGHNIIEPALYGKPVLFGSHMENFQEIATAFVERGAGFMVRNETELQEKIKFLLKDEDSYRSAGLQATKIIKENAGALDATVNEITKIYSQI